VTGSAAERNLLGAIILKADTARLTDGLVTGADFEDARLGRIWDGLVLMASTEQPISPEAVANRFPEWSVRGLTAAAPWEWTTEATPYAATEYANAVRSESVRRHLFNLSVTLRSAATELGTSPLDVATDMMGRLAHIVDGASSGRLTTKTLRQVLDGQDQYDWVIPGLLERRDRVILTGLEGAGKTTACRQIVVLSAAGLHPFTFKPIKPLRWLVVDAENTEVQWRRAVRNLSAKAEEQGSVSPADRVHIKAGSRIDITKGPHLSEIHRLIDVHKPDALYIGPLYKMVPGAINNDDDAAPLIVALDSLRDRGVTLLMEAHAGKSANAAGERNLAPRGSSALLGWPEFGLGLMPHEKDKGVFRVIKWRGDRDVRDWPRLLSRGGEWQWTPVTAETSKNL
jgi:hypothetical protein